MIQINMGLVYTVINIIVLYFLLRRFLIKPVTEIMEKREKAIQDGFKNAQDMQDDALKMKQEYEDALKDAKKESAEIVESARRNARSEYERIVAEAGEQAGNMIKSAKETVRAEREKTIKELRVQIAGLAAASAAKIAGGQDVYGQFLGAADKEQKNEDR